MIHELFDIGISEKVSAKIMCASNAAHVFETTASAVYNSAYDFLTL